MHLTCDLTRNNSNAMQSYITTRSRNNCYSRVNVLLTIFVLTSVIFLAVQEQNNLKNISNVLQADTWKVEFSRQHLSSVHFSEMVSILKTFKSEVGSWGLDFVLKNYVSSSRKADVSEPRQNNVSYMGVVKLADAEKDRPSLLYPYYYSPEKGKSNYDFIDGQSRWELSLTTVRRRLRATRSKEEVTELVEHGPEVIIKLENDAFEHSNLMDSAVLGKYNLWRREFESENSDLNVRLIRDQMILARVYLEIAKSKEKPDLYQELQAHLSKIQYTLGDAISDADLHPDASEKIKAMGRVLSKAKEQLHDCKTIGRKLRAMLQSADERVRGLKKQGSFLSQLAAKTIPNSIHCLSMRLTIDYNFLPSEKRQFPRSEKLEDPSLYHYALFSDNVLAASVVVNSTITNAKEPEKHVFHLVTDKLNYGAMSMWFLLNPPGNATIHVENIDDFHWLNSSYSPVLHQLASAAMREYYFKSGHPSSISSGSSNLKYRNPKYLSMLNHLRFYLPQVYPKLDKILFLDDDIVVQKDLTGLWSVDLKGKVNGAVETCGESFHRFDKYLNFSNPQIAENFDPNACGWAYGMNIFDLNEWKKRDITGIYHKWQDLNKDRALWKLGTLPPGLITFYGLTFSLDKSWHVLGLGYSPSIDPMEIQNAAVIHYNGNMKPWLGIAITKYKSYWTEYIKYDHPYLHNCD